MWEWPRDRELDRESFVDPLARSNRLPQDGAGELVRVLPNDGDLKIPADRSLTTLLQRESDHPRNLRRLDLWL
jgi:hypothetical protein